MRQNCHDFIAISNKVGKPDIFLGMTYNLHWSETENALLQNRKQQDHPDIKARAFKMKVKIPLKTLIDQKAFRNMAARVCIPEFQKK